MGIYKIVILTLKDMLILLVQIISDTELSTVPKFFSNAKREN